MPQPVVRMMEPDQDRETRRKLILGAVGAAIFVLFGLVVGYAWLEGLPGLGGDPQYVKAPPGPYRQAPSERGGMDIANENTTIIDVIRPPKKSGNEVEQVLPREPTPSVEEPSVEEPAVAADSGATETVPAAPPVESAQVPTTEAVQPTPDETAAPPPQASADAEPAATIPSEPSSADAAQAPDATEPDATEPDATDQAAVEPPSETEAPAVFVPVPLPKAEPPAPAQPARTQPASPPTRVATAEPTTAAPPPRRTTTPTAPPAATQPARTAPVTAAPAAPATPQTTQRSAPAQPAPTAGTPRQLVPSGTSAPTAPAPPPAQAQVAQAPVAAQAAPAVGAATFRLQLAALRNQGAVERAWADLRNRFPQALGGLAPRVEQASTASGTVFRLQAGAFSSREAAVNACSAIRAGGGECFIVGPIR